MSGAGGLECRNTFKSSQRQRQAIRWSAAGSLPFCSCRHSMREELNEVEEEEDLGGEN